MADVIDFTAMKQKAAKDTAEFFASFDMYVDTETGEVLGQVIDSGDAFDEADGPEADWLVQFAANLRALAWIMDRLASKAGIDCEPVAQVFIRGDGVISTRWNVELIQNEEQIQWVRDQLNQGADDIRIGEG